MPIYMSERAISVVCPQVSCDSCLASLNLVEELTDLRLEKSTQRSRMGFGGDGLFIIPGMPSTEEQAAAVAKTRGWAIEVVHGKSLYFCPGCQAV